MTGVPYRVTTAMALLLCSAVASAAPAAPPRFRAAPTPRPEASPWPVGLPSATSWFAAAVTSDRTVRLGAGRELPWLSRFAEPWIDLLPESRRFWSSPRSGEASWFGRFSLEWTLDAPPAVATDAASALASGLGSGAPPDPAAPEAELPVALLPWAELATLPAPWVDAISPVDPVDVLLGLSAPEFGQALFAAPIPSWHGFDRAAPCAAPAPVTLVRFGAEHDTFRLLECDGSVAPEALDRLSVIARPAGTPRPALPLPDVPPPGAQEDEWVPEVRMVHPRLVWLVQRLSSAFPGRSIYIISGYRKGNHGSFHRQGRALDLSIHGVPKEELLAACRKLRDVACGYYPNHAFIHVDVRAPGTGHVLWVDDSHPGAPSHYVDAWPGVVEGGALHWAGGE